MTDGDPTTPEPRQIASTRVGTGRLSAETLVLRGVTYLYAFPGSVVLARTLGPDGRGGYQLAVTTSVIVLTVVLAGLPQSQFRAWGRSSPGELLSVARLAALALGGVGAVAAAGVGILGGSSFDGEVGEALLLIALTVPFQVHSACLTVLLQSSARTRWVNGANAVAGVLQTSLILALWQVKELTVLTTAVAYVVGISLQWAALAIGSRAIGRPRPLLPIAAALSLIRAGLTLQTFIVAQFLLLRIDVILLARLADLDEVGVYAVGVLLAELVWMVTDSLASALVERATHDERPAALALFVRAARVTVAIALASVALLAAAAPLGVPLVFGDDFASSAPVVLLLLPGVVGVAVWRVLSPAIVRFGRISRQPVFAACALGANVVLNLLWIPEHGAAGAAAASTVAYLLGATLSVYWLSRAAGTSASDIVLPRWTDVEALRDGLRSDVP